MDVKHELEFMIQTWAKNVGQPVEWSEHEGITIGVRPENQLQLSASFVQRQYDQINLNTDGIIETEAGKPDYLATAFYLLNSLQEHNDTNRDELGRFRYSNSYQYKRSNADQNLVQNCFDAISKTAGLNPRKVKSSFLLTHDIDLVNGAWLEDGFSATKKGRVDQLLVMMLNMLIGRPDWLNMDKIMKLESEYDCKSVFYWLVNKGKINARERNSDYTFRSTAIQGQYKNVEAKGFENGLHKSISNESFESELKKFGTHPLGNRYHYLKFALPEAYHEIENAGLKLDASLGFAEQPGFRNSYGLPFNPYSTRDRRPFKFVEVPLHVMDRTFFQYKKASLAETEHMIFSFFERNRENCVLSVLWHNNFFTDHKFKGYLGLYKKILGYIRDNHFRTMSQTEIIEKFSISNNGN